MLHRTTHRVSDPGGQLPSTDPPRLGEKLSKPRRIPTRLLGRILLLLAFVVAGYVWYWHQLTRVAEGTVCSARLEELGVAGLTPGLLPGHIQHGHEAALAGRRVAAYAKMAADLPAHGVRLGGVITQGLKQQDLFTFHPEAPADAKQGQGMVRPVLRALEVPVRAVVMPIPEATSLLLHAKAREVLGPLLAGTSVWWQDPGVFHSTIYHASNMNLPVPADPAAVAAEAAAVAAVARATCPLQVVLERVVITSTGVLVACWQVAVGGGEPAALRDALQTALPSAPPPNKQLVGERAMLHTTIARLLAPSLRPAPAGAQGQVVPDRVLAKELVQVAATLTAELCGLTATAETLWYVEEQDLLALALQGRMVRRTAPLACPAA